MTATWRRGTLRGDVLPGTTLVVKLGGSLLVRAGWAADVAELLGSLPAPRVLVAGGGPIVDGLRSIDRAANVPAALTHRLAIECMGQTARVVSAALGAPLVAGIDRPPERTATCTVVLDAPGWLSREGRLEALPVGWHVTSDSIAAAVATACGGGLLLVKCVPPPHADVGRLAADGWIDAFFPAAAAALPWIGWAAPD